MTYPKVDKPKKLVVVKKDILNMKLTPEATSLNDILIDHNSVKTSFFDDRGDIDKFVFILGPIIHENKFISV